MSKYRTTGTFALEEWEISLILLFIFIYFFHHMHRHRVETSFFVELYWNLIKNIPDVHSSFSRISNNERVQTCNRIDSRVPRRNKPFQTLHIGVLTWALRACPGMTRKSDYLIFLRSLYWFLCTLITSQFLRRSSTELKLSLEQELRLVFQSFLAHKYSLCDRPSWSETCQM